MPFGHMFYYATDSATPVYYGGHMDYSPFGFGLMMFFGTITWILLTILLLLAVVWLWKQIQK